MSHVKFTLLLESRLRAMCSLLEMLRAASPRAIPFSCYAEGPFLDFVSLEEIAKGFISFPTAIQQLTTALLPSLSRCKYYSARKIWKS